MSGNGVDSMEKYKYMLGQAHAYRLILQEISNLLNHKEQKDEQGNVIDIGTKRRKLRNTLNCSSKKSTKEEAKEEPHAKRLDSDNY